MSDQQQTIKDETLISGVGLHTGTKTNVRIKPAVENHGIEFVRVDLEGTPHIKACPENIVANTDIPRCTAIGKGDAIIYTVEHLLSVFSGVGIDNAIVEIDGNELPGLDGSSVEYLKAIKKSGITEQSEAREYIIIKEPIGVSSNGASILIVPEENLNISYSLSYNHKFLKNQFFTTRMCREIFEKEIAPCRTFCLEEEAKELQANGLGKGASYDNTLVVGENGVIDNEVRFEDEFARHKVLDFLGDIYLLGKRVRGNVFAVKSGHYLNIELLKRIEKQNQKGFIPDFDFTGKNELDVHEIMKILPHRYPFLLVDRILEIEPQKRAIGLKNVTVNENFFTGHFPTRPVMPGVLMVEAMAQTGGVLVLTNEEHRGKLALFMGTDKVKFRKVVQPGDQLIFEVELIRDRTRSASLHGVTKVNGEVVAEADILFSFVDSSFLD